MVMRTRLLAVAAISVAVAAAAGFPTATAAPAERDAAGLAAIQDALVGVQVADTVVGVDASSNQVLVRVGESAADVSGLLAKADEFGDAVRVEYVDDSFSLHISGGSAIGAIQGDELPYCTLGFSVTAPPGMLGNAGLTAGHCTAQTPHWWEGLAWYYGPSVTADYPTDDFGLIANWGLLPQPGNVYRYDGTYQDITTAAWPAEGMAVCLSGATTGPGSGLSCGTVTALDQRVCYESGDCVEGMAETNAVAR
jgi:streptogrisin A